MPRLYPVVKKVSGGGTPPPIIQRQPGYTDDLPTVGAQVSRDLSAREIQAGCGLGLSLERQQQHNPAGVGLSVSRDLSAREMQAGCGLSMPDISRSISARLVAKDSYTYTGVGCALNSNHNGENLRMSVIDFYDSYIAWDLSQYPPNATITAATFRFYTTIAPPAASYINILAIADANEGWDETTITCSNRPPANGSTMQQILGGTTTGERGLALNSTVIARLQARIGQTSCTFLLQSVAGNYYFQSKDSGGSPGNAYGPRLEITFMMP